MNHQEDTDLSATLEQTQAKALSSEGREQWLAENREAVNAYNKDVEAYGVFSDGMRSF